MPRLSTQRQVFNIKDPEIMKYFGGNSTATTEYMKKVKSELSNKDKKDINDDKVIKWIDNEFDMVHKPEDIRKKIIMNTDGVGDKKGGNAFKDTHTKDNDNADPTRVRIPKITGGSREIMSNKPTYESIDKEINDSIYLIEYMNNNN